MPELHDVAHLGPALQRVDEASQSGHVFAQPARQLPQNGRESVPERHGMLAFEAHGGARIQQLLVVGQVAMGLERNAEARRGLASPTLESARLLQSIEGRIDLDGREVSSALWPSHARCGTPA
jgi:hypothetical protein